MQDFGDVEQLKALFAKFSGRDFYADTYGKWMAGTICDKLGTGFDGICWVPVSKKRRRVRGYYQSGGESRILQRHSVVM